MLQRLFIGGLWIWCNFCLLALDSEGADWRDEVESIDRLTLAAGISYPINTRPLQSQEIAWILQKIEENKGKEWNQTLEVLLAKLKQDLKETKQTEVSLSNESSFSNSYGESCPQGINLSVDSKACGKFYDLCSQLKLNHDGITSNLKWGYLEVSKWNTTIQAGRIPHWWGPGHSGAWLLTTNAQPFDQIRIANKQAVLLPYLGSSKLEFILGKLSKQTIRYNNNGVFVTKTEKPRLIGLRFDCSPNRYMEFGAGETCMLSGRDGLKIKDYWQAMFPGNNATIQETTNGPITNRIASIDATFRIPINHPRLKNAAIYWEYGGEDCNPTSLGFNFLSAPANLFGLYLDTGKTDMRVEYAEDEDDLVTWYTHGQFKEGYRHNGNILGHHMNGKSWYLHLTCPIATEQIGFIKAEMVNNKLTGIDLGCLNTWRLRIQPDNGVKIDYEIGW
ncbi:MAG: capsule assembly Wzi family protein [bacterium]|nr:capsule assembly Wzi family protein [bacterium]